MKLEMKSKKCLTNTQHVFSQAPWKLENSPMPSAWPRTGTIEFREYGLQYRKGLDWALKEITLLIKEREKVNTAQSQHWFRSYSGSRVCQGSSLALTKALFFLA